MRWFSLFKKPGGKRPEPKAGPHRSARPERSRPGRRERRERYSGWNDPDLPTYGDPFDG
jgi:hypothetical protein